MNHTLAHVSTIARVIGVPAEHQTPARQGECVEVLRPGGLRELHRPLGPRERDPDHLGLRLAEHQGSRGRLVERRHQVAAAPRVVLRELVDLIEPGDRFVGRALALMHEKPADAWTIDELGRQVGLSRSALHERFVQFVGQPPMQYLARWRMQLASGLLRSSNATVAAIALEVGYDSEAAFARAFKRLVGQPPAAWRRTLAEATRNEVASAPGK